MPPEELEKMHHIEKHIRKNKMKVGAGCGADSGDLALPLPVTVCLPVAAACTVGTCRWTGAG